MSGIYTYDNLGLLHKQVDLNGTTFTNQYHEQNRLTVSTVSLNGNVQVSKSIFGSSGIMVDTAETYLNGSLTGSMQSTMDNHRRITSLSTQSTNYASNLSLAYDSDSRIVKQTNNIDSFNVNYNYDRMRLDQIQIDGQSTVNTANTANVKYDYYANGQIKTITYPPLADETFLSTAYT